LLDGRDMSSLRAIPCGGSAVPKALSEGFRAKTGLPLLQAWGMTETSPIASVCHIKSTLRHKPEEELADVRTSAGIAVPGVDVRVVETDTTNELPWDGKSSGELQVAGPWIASTYYNDPRAAESFTADGWLRTGDVATIDADGYMQITDRSKDVIKSGGEWISSIEIENIAVSHPAVAMAACIGVAHPKWDERPIVVAVKKPNAEVTREELLKFYEGKTAKWQIPDDVVFVEAIPLGATGKILKTKLRELLKDYKLPTA